MSASINLVNQKNPNKDRDDRIRKLKSIAYSMLALTALIVLIIFALEYRFSASYVKKQQAQLLSELNQYSQKSAKFYIVSSNLTEIGNILNQRKNYHKVTKEILNLKPIDVTVSEYTHDTSGIKFSASTPSLLSLDSFLNSIIALTQKKLITSVILNGLNISDGKYSIEILIQ